jgi:hypothetical protein
MQWRMRQGRDETKHRQDKGLRARCVVLAPSSLGSVLPCLCLSRLCLVLSLFCLVYALSHLCLVSSALSSLSCLCLCLVLSLSCLVSVLPCLGLSVRMPKSLSCRGNLDTIPSNMISTRRRTRFSLLVKGLGLEEQEKEEENRLGLG